jgi:hypothetical protein
MKYSPTKMSGHIDSELAEILSVESEKNPNGYQSTIHPGDALSRPMGP